MKTNHRRGTKDNKDERTEYVVLEVHQTAPDGKTICAAATGPGVDHCRGKHGAARGRKGAKKYVHSRRRRRTRDWLKKQMEQVEE